LVWAYSAQSFAYGVQAADSSAHYACIDYAGFANFDESPFADDTACYYNSSYGFTSKSSRNGISPATSDGNNNQSFDNTAFPNVSGNYIFKDGDGYCWDVTWNGSAYTAVVEATYANYPDYAGVCANISAPAAPVSASVNSPLGLLLAMLGVAGIAGFLRRRQKKITH